MASPEITSIRTRGTAGIAAAVVLTLLTVAGSAPAGAAAQAAASPDAPVSPFVLRSSAQSQADAPARAQAANADADVTPIALRYLLDGGVFTRVDAPGPDLETVPYGINNRQQILGGYVDVGGTGHGFLLSKGRFSTFDVLDASGIDASRVINYPGTFASKINDRGQIAGAYSGPDGKARGFLKSRREYTTLQVPGAVETLALDVNDRGQVVGFYIDPTLRQCGFLGDRGTFTTIDAPGARTSGATGLNDRGQITAFSDLRGEGQ